MKTRALTEMVYIDEVEVDQEGIAEMMLDESSIAQVARKFCFCFVCLVVVVFVCFFLKAQFIHKTSVMRNHLTLRARHITETPGNESRRRSKSGCSVKLKAQCCVQ